MTVVATWTLPVEKVSANGSRLNLARIQRDVAGTVDEVPGAHAAIEEEKIPAVERVGRVFVDEALLSRSYSGVYPRHDRDGQGIQRRRVRHCDVVDVPAMKSAELGPA